jgi:hypothetical protein
MLYVSLIIIGFLLCVCIYLIYQLKGSGSKHNNDMKDLDNSYVKKQEQLQKDFESRVNDINARFYEIQQSYIQKEQSYDVEIQDILFRLENYKELENKVVEKYKQKEIDEKQRDFYRIILEKSDLSDVEKLNAFAPQLSKPVVLYKLMYEVYYKSKLEELFKRLIPSDCTSGGIYKITNIKNNKCYIGRTTNFLTRWRDHAKCGIGADSGAQVRNKFYEAIKMDGIENFTFEIIDRCEKDIQPEREKFWIDYYKSTEYGYNTVSGG